MPATPHQGRFSWPLGALALAMLLPSLGTSVANVALPSLQTAFSAPFGQVQWVVLAYLLAVTTLIVGVGRLGDMIGRRRLLLAGIGIFAVSSACAAIAPSLWVLVASRAVQGLGAAIMMALTVASVGDVVPKERVGSAMGLLGTVSAIGTALGPSLGGALLSVTTWPALFALMSGTGALTFIVGWKLLPAATAAERITAPFDLAGMVLLAIALAAYSLSTTLGGDHPGAFSAVLLGLAIVAAAAFVVVERRMAAPLVRIDLLKEAGLGEGLLSLALVSTIMMSTLVVGPFYLAEALGLSPIATGLVMSIGPAVAAIVGLPAGRLVDAQGSRRVMLFGLLAVIAGAAFMTVAPVLIGTPGYVGALSIITAGYALFQAANNTAVMAGATAERKGVTSGLLGLARNLGLITGASAMGALFQVASGGVSGLAGGAQAGMQVTFGAAALLAVIALVLSRREAH